jgi:molybdate transport system ATP-binding protein
MSVAFLAEFEKQFRGGPRIEGKLTLPADSFNVTVLFGPSGCGKTTVLRCMAGLERPERGFIHCGRDVWFDAARRLCLPPQCRDVGYLSQDYSLFPHLTVEENVGSGLSRLAAVDRVARVSELLELLGLTDLRRRYPRQLSGGQQQRVALARAVARRPRLLLLDEPLSALDAPTREQVRRQLRRWLAAVGVPTLLVTHDRLDTQALAGRVVILDGGRVRQQGLVDEVFSRPATPEVARIVGVDTILPVEVLSVADGVAEVLLGTSRLQAPSAGVRPGKAYACIRGEDVILATEPSDAGAHNQLTGTITTLTPEGPLVRVLVDCGFVLTLLLTRQACTAQNLREGMSVTSLVRASTIHLIARE